MTEAAPLIDALTEKHGWPRLDAATADAFIAGPGARVLFLTGDPQKNLETNDVAVILPELHRAFDGAFHPAIVDRAIEKALRERFDVWPAPSLIFLRDGRMTGVISKVRDWDEYLTRVRAILSNDGAAQGAAVNSGAAGCR